MCEKTRVLIGDGDFMYGAFCAEFFTKNDFAATTSRRSGFSILGNVVTNPPDVLIVADEMPELSALELICEMKRLMPYIPKTFVVASVDNPKTEREVAEVGAADYLVLPLEPMELLQRVKYVISEKNQK